LLIVDAIERVRTVHLGSFAVAENRELNLCVELIRIPLILRKRTAMAVSNNIQDLLFNFRLKLQILENMNALMRRS
jgi:hypothetical protein